MDKGTVHDVAFFSKVLQQQFNLLIYVPANYSPLYEYNILIASDGRDYFQLGAIPRLADTLIDDYDIEQTIIVGIPYENAQDRKRKYIPTGDQFDQYMEFLATELFPYLEQQYTIAEDVSKRALIGDSMAATASLLAALRYPQLFGKVALQSPYVDEHVVEEVKAFNSPEELFIYHIIGLHEKNVVTTDNTVKDFLTPNRNLHELLERKGVETFYEEIDGNHTWTYWKPDLKRALTQIFG